MAFRKNPASRRKILSPTGRLCRPPAPQSAFRAACGMEARVRRRARRVATSLWYPFGMTLKARVHKGRLLVDEPTQLPEGTEVDLLPLDPGDWLDPADRAALHRALAASQEDLEAGRLVDAEEVLKELRAS